MTNRPSGLLGLTTIGHIGGGKVVEVFENLDLGAARRPDVLMLGIGKTKDRHFLRGQQARQDLDQALRPRRGDGLRSGAQAEGARGGRFERGDGSGLGKARKGRRAQGADGIGQGVDAGGKIEPGLWRLWETPPRGGKTAAVIG